jgi:hypothetical protein
MVLGHQRRHRGSVLRGGDWSEDKNAGDTEKYFNWLLSQQAILAAFYIEGPIMSRGEAEAMELMFHENALKNIFAERCHNRPFPGPLSMRGKTVLLYWPRHASS